VLESCYFLTISCLSVGFGDIYPTHDGSRLFTIFMTVFGMSCIFTMVSGIAASKSLRKCGWGHAYFVFSRALFHPGASFRSSIC
jgi:hypothetical protein